MPTKTKPKTKVAGAAVSGRGNKLGRLVIEAGVQADGTTYALHPASRRAIHAAFPEVHTVRSLFVGYDVNADFEASHGPMWPQIVVLLTGLSKAQLAEFESVIIRVPSQDIDRVVEL